MKNLLVRILACVLVLTMVFAFAACKKDDPKDPGTDDPKDPGTDDPKDPGTDDPKEKCTEHVDADKDGKCDKCGADVPKDPECTEHVDANNDGKCDKCGADVPKKQCPEGEHVDEDNDGVCDICGYDELPIRFEDYEVMKNSSLTINKFNLKNTSGEFEFKDGVYTSKKGNSIGVLEGVSLKEGQALKIEFDYTSVKGTNSDDGVIFAINDGGKATYWEDVNYYFYFISQAGTSRFAEVAPWTNLDEKAIDGFTRGNTYHVVVEYDGAKSLKASVDGVALNNYTLTDAQVKAGGTKVALRAMIAGIKYENVKVTVIGNALKIGKRNGTWEVVDAGERTGVLHNTAATSLALIEEVETKGAKKITLSVDFRVDKDRSGLGNTNWGLVMDAFREEGVDYFWETAYNGYYFVYANGQSTGTAIGKWDAKWQGFTSNGAVEGATFNYGDWITITGELDYTEKTLKEYWNGIFACQINTEENPLNGMYDENGDLKEGVLIDNGCGFRANQSDVYFDNARLEILF